MSKVFSLARLGAMLAKEFIQMRRDRVTFAMMLGVPLMQLVLFGFAINNDPKSLPAALVAASSDHYTRAMVSALQTTGYTASTMWLRARPRQARPAPKFVDQGRVSGWRPAARPTGPG